MTFKTIMLGLAFGTSLAVLAGCNSGSSVPIPPPATSPSTTRFSFFTEQVLGASAHSTPVQINDVVFDFDVNDDPNAFNYALM